MRRAPIRRHLPIGKHVFFAFLCFGLAAAISMVFWSEQSLGTPIPFGETGEMLAKSAIAVFLGVGIANVLIAIVLGVWARLRSL